MKVINAGRCCRLIPVYVVLLDFYARVGEVEFYAYDIFLEMIVC